MRKFLLSSCILAPFVAPALADGTIDTLSSGAVLSGSEQIPMFQTANPAVKTTPAAILVYAQKKLPVWSPSAADNMFYFLWPGAGGATGAAAPSQNTAACTPFLAPGGISQHIDQLAINVTTLGAGPLNVALYTDGIDGTTNRHQPQTLISSSSFTVTGTGQPTAAMGSNGVGVPIAAGLSWVCINDTNSGDAVRFNTVAANATVIAQMIGSTSAANETGTSTFVTNLLVSETAGTWPSFAGVSFTENTTARMPMMAARVASVP